MSWNVNKIKKMNKIFVLLITVFLFGESIAQTTAFPGAEGGGMFASGGRGGVIYYVNNLTDNDEGNEQTREGSFRWCINQTGKRTILFKVSGIIWLESGLNISNRDLTIAGQSAPGDGVCIAGYPVNVSGDNIIIRYLRFRMGDAKISGKYKDGADAIGGRKTENVIIDHCSISWGTDECSSFYDNRNFTMQWCIISESLRLAGHSKGPHGYGAIWGGVNASFHHNLLAHHDSRTPRFGPGVKHAGTDTVDVRNNVFYNWSGNGCYGGEAMHINIINNYYKPGPATGKKISKQIVALDINAGTRGFERIKEIWGKYYISGNYVQGNEPLTHDNWSGVVIRKNKQRDEIELQDVLTTTPIYMHDVHTAYDKVLMYAGCSKVRDEVDIRIIKETLTGTAQFFGLNSHNGEGGEWKSLDYPKKGLIDSQSDLKPEGADKNWSAWPALRSGELIVDKDGDGIPDGWLQSNHPGKKANDMDKDGYTYLELYLNSLVKHISEKQL